jgi:hypothetical protein
VPSDIYVVAITLQTEFPDERCVTANLVCNTRAHLRDRQPAVAPERSAAVGHGEIVDAEGRVIVCRHP